MATDTSLDPSPVFVIAEAGVVRMGLQSILEQSDNVQVHAVADADLLDEEVEAPDAVAVVHVTRGGALRPHLASTVPVIVVAEDPTDVAIANYFAAGACGLVLIDSAPRLLADAVQAVRDAGHFIDPHAAGAVVAMVLSGRRSRGPFGLTSREQRVLALMSEGARNRDIAEQLGISPETVKTHVRQVLAKLDASDRHQAVAAAREFGLS